ncbi:MAG: hypothetical protein ACKVPX_12065 [Myxococcaceae bacterium]
MRLSIGRGLVVATTNASHFDGWVTLLWLSALGFGCFAAAFALDATASLATPAWMAALTGILAWGAFALSARDRRQPRFVLHTATSILRLEQRQPGRQSTRGCPLASGAGLAIACLVMDAVLAIKLNVPINSAINGWRTSALPEDWQTYRARWHRALAIRRIFLVGGLLALFGTVLWPA